MIATLEQDLKNKRSNSLKTDLNKYLIDKNKITEFTKRTWFKGCRFR